MYKALWKTAVRMLKFRSCLYFISTQTEVQTVKQISCGVISEFRVKSQGNQIFLAIDFTDFSDLKRSRKLTPPHFVNLSLSTPWKIPLHSPPRNAGHVNRRGESHLLVPHKIEIHNLFRFMGSGECSTATYIDAQALSMLKISTRYIGPVYEWVWVQRLKRERGFTNNTCRTFFVSSEESYYAPAINPNTSNASVRFSHACDKLFRLRRNDLQISFWVRYLLYDERNSRSP
jgi:hypothetical protein